ncbi:MAG: TlpA family protein disulfide reductase [Acidobacteria bacterium]|nr:MAG: TlpA family protein disulfide reductase [Acidobacteriota bacterium]REK02957.1 MAG: TlpA family protein disulfide reductase [Acidobacteriota bacterium]REK13239.1 MAG: TlpA family protein disulfide reductase [Acidobacteriota bacterium]REK41233.1 MAG: TlpA family protein disulfide reductase [Acidobacteriota bacterium]
MKRSILIAIVLIALAAAVFPQYEHEYADIELKRIEYKNWEYPNGLGEGKTNLREFVKGKKLVLVFYFAPWCHSSRYQAPITQRFYEEYGDKGFGVIGVSMYDTEEALRKEMEKRDLSFPVVIESTRLADRRFSQHFKYRWSTGDHRKWGTPWNIFLFPSKLKKKGDLLTKEAYVVNGELKEEQAEKFIREKLGLESD